MKIIVNNKVNIRKRIEFYFDKVVIFKIKLVIFNLNLSQNSKIN